MNLAHWIAGQVAPGKRPDAIAIDNRLQAAIDAAADPESQQHADTRIVAVLSDTSHTARLTFRIGVGDFRTNGSAGVDFLGQTIVNVVAPAGRERVAEVVRRVLLDALATEIASPGVAATYTPGVGWQFENPYGRGGNYDTEAEALAAGAEYLQARTSAMPWSEMLLRTLLAHRCCPASLYTDDGELSDASVYPTIDFKRDSAESIACKLRARARQAAGIAL